MVSLLQARNNKSVGLPAKSYRIVGIYFSVTLAPTDQIIYCVYFQQDRRCKHVLLLLVVHLHRGVRIIVIAVRSVRGGVGVAGTFQIALSLLDPVKGHPIQTWEFDDRSLVRIGRGDANDVVIGDPIVSRLHIELVSEANGQWRIVSLGRNGTWIDGERVSQSLPIRHGMIMQLGSNGPCMEFREDRRPQRASETIMSWNAPMVLPQVDQEIMKTEVSRIADGDDFEDLRKQAQELKRAREEKNRR
jgi:hypothetical protein